VYREATDFCKLILCSTTLLKLFMVFRNFGVEFFGSLRYKIMHLLIGIVVTSLPICVPFIYFSCFIALARNSRVRLNRSGEIGHPCLILDLGEIVSVFPNKYEVGCMLFVIYTLYNVEVHSFYS
jgi:hypothetical protein